MSEPTIEEMREQLVNNEIDYITQVVTQDRREELFNYVYKNSWNSFKNINEEDVKTIYMDLYGDMFHE